MPAKVDGEKCTGCEACVESCPSEAIAMAADKAVVDADKCVDCGVCVDECPVEAISME
ncbi:MAG: 4Fe-4S binding protein [Planctomycetes bacterium]|nr:4Fe-4S binding protein [Planctomycetota bacterium]